MSYDKTTIGFEKLDGMQKVFNMIGLPFTVERLQEKRVIHAYMDVYRHLRRMKFVHPVSGRPTVAQEYVSHVSEDCDFDDLVSVEVFEEGTRPDLEDKPTTPDRFSMEYVVFDEPTLYSNSDDVA